MSDPRDFDFPDEAPKPDIPDRLTTEGDLNAPKAEEVYTLSSYRPDTKERRILFEMLQIEGMTVKMAAAAAQVSITTFRKVYAREIAEAAKIRAALDPGADFRPMAWHRSQVASMSAAGLKPEQICGVMFRGTVEMSRFNAWFGHEISTGAAAMVGTAIDRMSQIMKTGNDRDARLVAKDVMKWQGLGGFRETTRHDHNQHQPDGQQTTADKRAQVERDMVEEMVTQGHDRASAEALVRMLSSSPRQAPRQPLN